MRLVSLAPVVLALFAASTVGASPSPERLPAPPLGADDPRPHHGDDDSEPSDLPALAELPCEGGMAGPYPCDSVDLEAFVPLDRLSPANQRANDIWGWTDPETGSEYAVLGLSDGTSFIDVTHPSHPHWVGFLPTATFFSGWRDVKVVGDVALVVSEARSHGLQVFDLTRLRDVEDGPVTFEADAWYRGFGNAHNVAVNPDSPRAYVVGSNSCSRGVHVVDLTDPFEPTFAGCFSDDGYTHDAQCVTYSGPDMDWRGREICLLSNEDTLTIVDMTDASAPVQLARRGYPRRGYTHQGWLTEDQGFFFVGDELDEWFYRTPTRTLVWDVRDLDDPVLHDEHLAATAAIDHNMYVDGQLLHQANYRAGLRILDIGCFEEPDLREVGFFDVFPANDAIGFNGAWSVYPWFASGTVVVSGREQGLFVLRPTGLAACPDVDPPDLEGLPSNETLECPDEPATPTVEALDGCDDDAVVEVVEETIPGDCPGRWTLVRTWTARDACGNETVATRTSRVDDTTPPVVVASSEVAACLWPPSHRARWIPLESFSPEASDSCSEAVSWRIVGCSSDEPEDGLGDGATTGDCVVAEDGSGVWARSERSGLGDGRVLTVLAVAEDACGNASSPAPVGTIRIPHDAASACD